MTEEIRKEEGQQTPPAPQPDLRELAFKWLDEAPAEEILKHSRVGGIVGQRQQTAREQGKRESQTESAERARREAEAEFQQLANDDPAEFSRRWLGAQEQERIQRHQTEITQTIQREFGTGVAEAFQQLPEWGELTPEEFNQLQTAVVGKDGKDALGAFAVAAANIVSDRKATKRVAEYRAKDLDKEREAIRVEEAAKLLQNSDRPDLTKGNGTPTRFDPTKLSDKEFDEFYRKSMLGRL